MKRADCIVAQVSSPYSGHLSHVPYIFANDRSEPEQSLKRGVSPQLHTVMPKVKGEGLGAQLNPRLIFFLPWMDLVNLILVLNLPVV